MTNRMLMMCAVLAVGVTSGIAGCGSAATAVGPDDGACVSNEDCPGGQVCSNSVCTDTGTGGSDGGVTGGDCDAGSGGNGSDSGDTGTGGGSDGGTGGGDTGTGGGSDGGTGGGDTGTCETDEQCPPGTTCQEGTCVCDGDPPAGSCGSGKSLMCHYPPGNPENRHEVCVGNAAVPAHLAHGDSAGNCP